MAALSPEARESMTNGIRNHAAAAFGIIKCYGPNGEYIEARSQREVTQLTGIPKSSVNYALKNGTTPRGWVLVREQGTIKS